MNSVAEFVISLQHHGQRKGLGQVAPITQLVKSEQLGSVWSAGLPTWQNGPLVLQVHQLPVGPLPVIAFISSLVSFFDKFFIMNRFYMALCLIGKSLNLN